METGCSRCDGKDDVSVESHCGGSLDEGVAYGSYTTKSVTQYVFWPSATLISTTWITTG